MYRIGELASICNISQKTLRFYEKKGLIKPAMINEETGYRYYDDDNIKTIEIIIHLKKLGMSIKQIKEYFDSNGSSLNTFIFNKFNEMQKSIRTLSLLENNEKGEFEMKNFINDENAIGKWNYLGFAKNMTEAKQGNLDTKPYFLQEIYFLENGQGYWLISSWSKGKLDIYIGEYPISTTYPYEIDGDKLYVSLIDKKSKQTDSVAVYGRVDRKKYKIEDLKRVDDVNLPFVADKKVVGLWKGVAITNHPENFSPDEKIFPSYVYDIDFKTSGLLIIRYTSGRVANEKWTKGFCIDLTNSLVSKYKIKTIEEKEYLIVENKNGDYIYNGKVSSYFVFDRA